MGLSKEEVHFLGYSQALEEFCIMFTKNYNEDNPSTPEEVRNMVIENLDELRVSCIRKLGHISSLSHPVWILD